MWRRRKRTEITVETEETVILRSPGNVTKGWCPECAANVSLTTLESATAIVNVRADQVRQGIASGHVHSTETPDGRWLVCLSSLLRWTTENKADAQS